MNHLVYVAENPPLLVERWINAHNPAGNVVLLASSTFQTTAENLKSRFPAISKIIPLPPEESTDQELERFQIEVQTLNTREIILPMSFDKMDLRFQPGTNIPDLKSRYPLFRQLWRGGIRDFIVFNYHGTRKYSIDHMLDDFTDIHKGQRCFLIGNGPSLNQLDMPKLKNEITFGCNRGFLGLQKWGFDLTYWAFGDRLQVEEYWYEYENVMAAETVKFFPFDYVPFLKIENYCPINFLYGYKGFPKFSGSAEVLYLGHSMIYMMLQIAITMGCNPIILIGVDHHYNLNSNTGKNTAPMKMGNRFMNKVRKLVSTGVDGEDVSRKPATRSIQDSSTSFWTASDASGATHFDPRYTEGDKKRFIPPRPELSEEAYAFAAKWALENGVEILNATPGSALEAFPKTSFGKLFQ